MGKEPSSYNLANSLITENTWQHFPPKVCLSSTQLLKDYEFFETLIAAMQGRSITILLQEHNIHDKTT